MKSLISAVMCFCLFASPIMAEDVSNPSTSYGDANTSPGSRVNRARGHSADKEHVYTNDIINGVYGRGWDGAAFSTTDRVSIEEQAAENWTTTANGTSILLKTTPKTTTTMATSLTVSSTGLTLLSNAAPRTNLTPLAAGTLVWNSQDAQLCVSTGTTATTWVQVADGTTACSH